jgi:hypothetical protein
MNGYVDRFQGRLRHLVELIDARGLRYEMTLRDDYGYVLEMRMLGVVASGRRPDWGLASSYLSAVKREHQGVLRRIMHVAFTLGLLVLPDTGRQRLARFRLDPAQFQRVRTRLKQSLSVPQ